jgi:hypothetical protein
VIKFIICLLYFWEETQVSFALKTLRNTYKKYLKTLLAWRIKQKLQIRIMSVTWVVMPPTRPHGISTRRP